MGRAMTTAFLSIYLKRKACKDSQLLSASEIQFNFRRLTQARAPGACVLDKKVNTHTHTHTWANCLYWVLWLDAAYKQDIGFLIRSLRQDKNDMHGLKA